MYGSGKVVLKMSISRKFCHQTHELSVKLIGSCNFHLGMEIQSDLFDGLNLLNSLAQMLESPSE